MFSWKKLASSPGIGTAFCFLPHRLSFCTANGAVLTENEIFSGAQRAKITVESNVTDILYSPHADAVLAACEDGSFYMWNHNKYSLEGLFTPTRKDEKRPVEAMCVCATKPYLYYAREGEKIVKALNLKTRKIEYRLDGSRKPIKSVACHPTLPILACCEGVNVRVYDLETQILRYVIEDFADDGKRLVHSVTFSSEGLLIAAGGNSRVVVWDISGSVKPKTIATHLPARASSHSAFLTVQCHPWRPCFFALSADRAMKVFKVPREKKKDKKLQPSFVFSEMIGHPALSGKHLSVHPSLDLICITESEGVFMHLALDKTILSSVLPLCISNNQSESAEIYYIDEERGKLVSHNCCDRKNRAIMDVPTRSGVDRDSRLVSFNYDHGLFLFFIESVNEDPSFDEKFDLECCIVPRDGNDVVYKASRHGVVLSRDKILLIGKSGRSFAIINANQFDEPVPYSDFSFTVLRVFKGPVDIDSVLYYSAEMNSLMFSTPSPLYSPITSRSFKLMEGEMVRDVVWDKKKRERGVLGTESFAAVLTSQRLIVTDKQLKKVTQLKYNEENPVFSCVWVGDCILYSNVSSIYCLCLDGSTHEVAGLSGNSVVLSSYYSDRIGYVCRSDNGSTEYRWQAIGFLEPLLWGALTSRKVVKNTDLRASIMEIMKNDYDSDRVSGSLLTVLAEEGMADIALEIAKKNPTRYDISQLLRLSEQSGQFLVAWEILGEAHRQDVDFPALSQHSPLRPAYRTLANICIGNGQFSLALRCLEMIGDDWGQFTLLALTGGRGLNNIQSQAKEKSKSDLSSFRPSWRDIIREDAKDLVSACAVQLASSIAPPSIPVLKNLLLSLSSASGDSLASLPSAVDIILDNEAAVAFALLECVDSPYTTASALLTIVGTPSICKVDILVESLVRREIMAKDTATSLFVDNPGAGPSPATAILGVLCLTIGSQWISSVVGTVVSSAVSDPLLFISDNDAFSTLVDNLLKELRESVDRFPSSLRYWCAKIRQMVEEKFSGQGLFGVLSVVLTHGVSLILTRPSLGNLVSDKVKSAMRRHVTSLLSSLGNAILGVGRDSLVGSPDPRLGDCFELLSENAGEGKNSSPWSSDVNEIAEAVGLLMRLVGTNEYVLRKHPELASRDTIKSPLGRSVPSRRFDMKDWVLKRPPMPQFTLPEVTDATPKVFDGKMAKMPFEDLKSWVGHCYNSNVIELDKKSVKEEERPEKPLKPSGPIEAVRATHTRRRSSLMGKNKGEEIPEKKPEDVDTAIIHSAAQLLHKGISALEKGKNSFAESLDFFNQCLRALSKVEEKNNIKPQVKMSVAYILALKMLMAAESEPDPSRRAVLYKFLADIPLRSKHRAICIKMAIGRNMSSGNFGVAARLLEITLGHIPPSKQSEIRAKLDICSRNDYKDEDFPSFTCPQCQVITSGAAQKCGKCGYRIRFCFETWKLIESLKGTICDYCHAVFSEGVNELESTCTMCGMGVVRSANAQ